MRLKMTEKDLQAGIIDLAKRLRWTVAHFRPARVACEKCAGKGWVAALGGSIRCKACKGTTFSWRTPVEADGAGFPDLVLVRDRVIFAELKVSKRKLRPEQQAWRQSLIDAGAEYYVWTEKEYNSETIWMILTQRRVGGENAASLKTGPTRRRKGTAASAPKGKEQR